ncbi:hypothetical protein MMC14_005745 [Varicellaria rhodocarpa]|nr:hypothetical protein [Varicellaria rhodocarpa]
MPNEALLERIKRYGKPGVDRLLAIRRLPSEDIMLQADSEEARKMLEKESSWVQAVAPTATVLRQTHAAFVHGVRVANIQTNDQQAAARRIEAQNKSLHPELEVVRMGWPRMALEKKKTFHL